MIEARNYLAYDKLRDGRTVVIRAIKPSDKNGLQEGMRHLAPVSRCYRFLTPKNELTPKELAYFTELDFVNHVGIGASVVENGVRVSAGTARFIVSPTITTRRSAEFAIAVSEEYQGIGVGKALFNHLIRIALANGITEFTALVLYENAKMLRLIERSGQLVKRRIYRDGTLELKIELSDPANIAQSLPVSAAS